MPIIQTLGKAPALYVMWVTMVAFSVCMHEAAHAWVARAQGDDTACSQGFFTLNPLKVMGKQSLLCLFVLGIAWGAVPVNPRNLRHSYSAVLVSCSGPGMNLLLATLFAAITASVVAAGNIPLLAPFRELFFVGAIVNCFLFIFNMLPVPMFDGWELYSWCVPQLRRLSMDTLGFISIVVIAVVFLSPAGDALGAWARQMALFLFNSMLALTSLLR
jgi:Zn-dependent protease